MSPSELTTPERLTDATVVPQYPTTLLAHQSSVDEHRSHPSCDTNDDDDDDWDVFDDEPQYESEIDFAACLAEGVLVAYHAIRSDSVGARHLYEVFLWRGQYWALSDLQESEGPYTSLLDAIVESEFFLLHSGVWHDVGSAELAHKELVKTLELAQTPDVWPDAPMELDINDQRYVLTPEGTLETGWPLE